jgi:hypothetical protein
MKNWLVIGSAVVALTACGQGSKSVALQSCQNSPQLDQMSQSNISDQLEVSAVASSTKIQNPFERFGKVLIAGEMERLNATSVNIGGNSDLNIESFSLAADPLHSPYIQAKSMGGVKVAAGTELTIGLHEACDGGDFSKQIISTQTGEIGYPTPSGHRSYTWVVPVETDTNQLEVLAESDPCIEGISDSQKARAMVQNTLSVDPLVATQAHLQMLSKDEAMPRLFPNGNRSKPVVIAIIDTGIDMNHEDLKDNLWTNAREIPDNKIDDDRNGFVDDIHGYNFPQKIGSPQYQGTWAGYHHGTHVSGLAAAQSDNGKGGSGVMGSGVKIMMLNVFGSDSGAYSSDTVNAIRYAADNGADVINMSLGGTGRNAAYEAAIAYAIGKGVTIFAAAGNEHAEIGPMNFMSPASYGQQFAGMVSVGSIDSKSSGLSTFSNFSPTYVELGAPGSESSTNGQGLLSTMPNNRYARAQGTSMASPVAAGAAALVIASLRSRGLVSTPALVEDIVTNSGPVVGSLQGKVRGGHILNLKTMADYIDKKLVNNNGNTGSVPVTSSSAASPTCL